jgi:hypothetical protein
MPKGKDLTPKQRRFVKGYLETGNATEAAKTAGYSEKSANSIAAENLAKPSIREAISQLMEKHGLSDEKLLSIHKDLLSATRTVSGIEVPDWDVRARALEMAYKLRGAYQEDLRGLRITISLRPPAAAIRETEPFEIMPEGETEEAEME